MKKNQTILLFLFPIFLVSCTKFGPEQDKAWELIDAGALIIDVRSKDEFKESHLDNAINIEYDNLSKLSQHIKANNGAQVVLYCRSGRRASVAMHELSKMGFNNVFNGGGLKAMIASLNNKNKH